MKRLRLLPLTAAGWLAVVLLVSPGVAQRDSFAIRAKRLLPQSPDLPQEISGGVLVVRDGRIAAIGTVQEVAIPPDLTVLEFPDAVITPGFIAAASNLGGSHRGDESVAAGYLAVDEFDRYGDYAELLASGVTAVHLSPGGHRLLTGQGAVVRLGGPPARRVLAARADLTINLTPASYDPPRDVTYPFPASADVAICPPRMQRPGSRLGQLLGLNEAIQDALEGKQYDAYSLHGPFLKQAWQAGTPLRIRAERQADLLAGLRFLEAQQRQGYLVGGTRADGVADAIREAGVPLVYRPWDRFGSAGDNIGTHPDALELATVDYRRLSGIRLALGARQPEDLRLTAVRAVSQGLPPAQALAAITRAPAEILGIADRVGSLEVGKDADFLVLTGDPLAVRTHVRRVYIAGRLSFEPPPEPALIIQAGHVWASPDQQIENGEILIENGKIAAVGRSVPHPPFARVIDTRPAGFVTPGFIDAFGHLGLAGDETEVACDLRLSKLFGAADVPELRVAAAGVTTVLVSPYKVSSRGATGALVKTAGSRREQRVVRDPAAVILDLAGADPLSIPGTLEGLLAKGRKYLDAWTKYEKDLKAFLEKQQTGNTPQDDQQRQDQHQTPEDEKKESETPAEPDPLTGTWEATISEIPTPEPVSATFEIQLVDSSVAGRVTRTSLGITGKLSGHFDGEHVSAEIFPDQEIPNFQPPIKVEADLTGEDHLQGSITAMGILGKLDAHRTGRSPVEFIVTRRRPGKTADGRPLPPKIDPNLEPWKSLLENKIPALVHVKTAAQIRAVLDVLVEKHKLSVTLVGAEEASSLAAKLKEKGVPVVLPPIVARQRNYRQYVQADDLARSGVSVAFQSNVEDGARHLPAVALFAVERGLGAETALRSLTLEAAKSLKIDDRAGTIEVGKDADLVIFSDHPFKAAGQVQRVIISGQEVRP